MKRFICLAAICSCLIGCKSGKTSVRVAEQSVNEPSVAETSADAVSAEAVSASTPEADASDFVLVTDVIPEVILEIRYYSSFNFVGTRIDGYEEPVAIMTKESAAALKKVSEKVAGMGYALKIFDAYRPQKAVDHFIRWAADPADTLTRRYFYPDIPKSAIIPRGFVATKSGHSRGSTVDLTLFDKSKGCDVDMGGSFDWFGEESHFDYAGVTPEQRSMRNLLNKVMREAGFHGMSGEWWHFTLNNEPFPDTYFTFVNSSSSVERIQEPV